MKCWKDVSIEKFYFEASNLKFTDLLYLKQSIKNKNLIPNFFKLRKSS